MGEVIVAEPGEGDKDGHEKNIYNISDVHCSIKHHLYDFDITQYYYKSLSSSCRGIAAKAQLQIGDVNPVPNMYSRLIGYVKTTDISIASTK